MSSWPPAGLTVAAELIRKGGSNADRRRNLYVHPEERDKWIQAHHEMVKIVRSAPGCIDLYICADPIGQSRVNMFEQWESEADLQDWRAVADPPPKPEMLSAHVLKYQISSSGPPF